MSNTIVNMFLIENLGIDCMFCLREKTFMFQHVYLWTFGLQQLYINGRYTLCDRKVGNFRPQFSNFKHLHPIDFFNRLFIFIPVRGSMCKTIGLRMYVSTNGPAWKHPRPCMGHSVSIHLTGFKQKQMRL